MEQNFNPDAISSLSEDMKATLLKLLGNKPESNKRLPFAKGDGVVIWENSIKTGENAGEKYYSVQILGGKGIPCYKLKHNGQERH